ncbi:MAG: hypothetical protein RL711_108 [Bacteroidota bacterium]|jgi:hypothetical protein
MDLPFLIIATAMSLLSLSAGLWLFQHAQKENLQVFYKIVAVFVMFVSFCLMVGISLLISVHCCRMMGQCHEWHDKALWNKGNRCHCYKGMEHADMGKHMMMHEDNRAEKEGKCCQSEKDSLASQKKK